MRSAAGQRDGSEGGRNVVGADVCSVASLRYGNLLYLNAATGTLIPDEVCGPARCVYNSAVVTANVLVTIFGCSTEAARYYPCNSENTITVMSMAFTSRFPFILLINEPYNLS